VIEELLLIALLAFVMEVLDSSVGMGYGTILSPVLIILKGYPPEVVIPSILLSQALSGTLAGFFHHKYKNVQFKIKECTWFENLKKGFTEDLRKVLMVSVIGAFVISLGVFVTLRIPHIYLKTYIGILVLIIGALLLSKKRFTFSWKKLFIVSTISTFNKGFTGGGFGPVLTGGQILGGQEEKTAIGCTTLAEGPVCIAGFIAFSLMNGGLQPATFYVLGPMLFGALIGAPTGSFFTKKLNRKTLKFIVGFLMFFIGIWTLIKIWL